MKDREGSCLQDSGHICTAGVQDCESTCLREGIVVEAVVDDHRPLGVALVLAVDVDPPGLDVVRRNFPPKVPAQGAMTQPCSLVSTPASCSFSLAVRRVKKAVFSSLGLLNRIT